LSDELVILVPVLDRPGRVTTTILGFENTNSPGKCLFIVQEDDYAEIQALDHEKADYLVVPPERTTWPQKINEGVAHTTAPWILFAADDVRPWPGWWLATRDARRDGVGVIGTNDMGNPRVMAGKHTTHPLVRRSYIEDEGASLDGPGLAICEEYRHSFSDDELVQLAMARLQWRFCSKSVIEHLHPFWGKGSNDRTYEIGTSHFLHDQHVWQARCPRIMELFNKRRQAEGGLL
jgi:hypothetical protein